MRRILVIVILTVFFAPLVSAETYLISGKATYADNTPVPLDYVLIECEAGNTQCYQYRGTKAMTDLYYFEPVEDFQQSREEWNL